MTSRAPQTARCARDWSAAISVDGDGVSPIPEYFPDGVHFSLAGAEAAGQALAPAVAAALEAAP